jgi:uracil-DNA glycosylase family 4
MRQLDMFGEAAEHREAPGASARFPLAGPFTSLGEARTAAQDCPRCDLSLTRQRVVFGAGPATARLAIVGEGPAEADDRSGLPFSGPSGHLLGRWLASIALARDDVWLSNVVRCRPTAYAGGRLKNRPPRAGEIAACRMWLETELALLDPALILGFGGTAGKALIGKEFRLTQDRGRWAVGPGGVPTLVTYHPAFILRLEGEAQAAAEGLVKLDLAEVRRRLDESPAG